MDYENTIEYFMELFDRQFHDSFSSLKKGQKSKVHTYLLSFFRRWYYSALIDDTLLSPANFVSELGRVNNKQMFLQPIIHRIGEGDQAAQSSRILQYSADCHPVINDLKIFIECCMPDITVDEDLLITEKDMLLIAKLVSICDPFYVEYLNLLAIHFDILVEAPSIHSCHARISENYDKLYSKSSKEIFFEIYEMTAKISVSQINQVLPLNKGIINTAYIFELLRNPITTDALFEKIYFSLGIDISAFFDHDENDVADFDDEGLDEFYHMVMSSTFFLGITFDKYFHTLFGFYLKIITPEFLIPYNFRSDFKFFLDVIKEFGDIETALFSPCTCFHLTEFGKIVTNSNGDNPNGENIPGPFDDKLSLERAVRMIKIMNGDEEADNDEVRSIVSDIFGLPEISDVYDIKISFMADKKYWKAMEIVPINPLRVLFIEICAAFGIRETSTLDYCFYMSGQEDVFSCYAPYDPQKPSKKTTDNSLADFNLPVGHKFLLVIQGQDPLKFEIEIKAIKKYNHKKAYPNILRVGQAFSSFEDN